VFDSGAWTKAVRVGWVVLISAIYQGLARRGIALQPPASTVALEINGAGMQADGIATI